MVEEFVAGEENFAQLVRHTNGIVKMFTQINKVRLTQPLLGAMIQM